jgi:cellulose synthase/poly-beta-1,6-N-acetylglucosamine synthase-like glycosyltransferase
MTAFLVLMYALVVPYIGLMLMVVVGMFRVRKNPENPDTPSVSVIIPAHNEEDKLYGTLESLSQQVYAGELEFVIVNDRSVDATANIIDTFVARDPRFKRFDVQEPSKRLAPKVNAVNHGINNSTGEIILTSDADCRYTPNWVAGMVRHFEPDVAMVVGYVESTQPGEPSTWIERFESVDWLTLMLTSRSLTHFGWKFASSANNQGYRREAFDAVGGFGAMGRAPSGDEDLLTQRIGRLQDKRIVFASTPDTRVYTQPMSSVGALLNQRRRWVSRYHHLIHYHPAFLLSIFTLGFQSVFLSLGVILSLFVPAIAPWVFGLWAVKLAVEIGGMALGTAQLERRDLYGMTTITWALLHPFFIGTIVLWSLLRSGEWRAGARSYRRRFFKRQVRELRRKVLSAIVVKWH